MIDQSVQLQDGVVYDRTSGSHGYVSKYLCYDVGPMVCCDAMQDQMLMDQRVCELLDSRANRGIIGKKVKPKPISIPIKQIGLFSNLFWKGSNVII